MFANIAFYLTKNILIFITPLQCSSTAVLSRDHPLK